MPDWLIRPIIVIVVTAVVISALKLGSWFIERATPKIEGESRLSPIYGGAGLLSGGIAGLVLAMGYLGGMGPDRQDFGAWLGLLCVFSVSGVMLVVMAANFRLWLSDIGLQTRDPFGRSQPFTLWGEVERVRVRWDQQVVFDRKAGGRIVIPFYTPGLLEAARRAAKAGAAMSDELRQQLKAAERGS